MVENKKLKLTIPFYKKLETGCIQANGVFVLYMDVKNDNVVISKQQTYFNLLNNFITNNKGAKHYNFNRISKKEIYEFRLKILDCLFDHSSSKKDTKQIPIELIKELNNFYFNNPLELITFLRGSNPEGSKNNPLRSPVLISEGKYKDYRFNHIFEKKGFEKKMKHEINESDYDEITFENFLTNLNLIEVFKNYNSDKINNGYPTTDGIYNNNLKTTFEEEKTDNEYWSKNREELRINLLKKHKHIYEITSTHVLQAAHILPVNKIDKEKNGSDLSNPSNGILMTADLHVLFDKNFFTFSEKGDIILNPEIKNIEEECIIERKSYFDKIDIKKIISDDPDMIGFIKKRNSYLYWVKNKFS